MKDAANRQMRWVILLLAIAVILPTVCLLWFMTQAVKNERLAVRQKLVDVYTQRAQYFFNELPDAYFDSFIKRFDPQAASPPPVIYDNFAIKSEGILTGMLIYDANGNLAYPFLATENTDEDKALSSKSETNSNIKNPNQKEAVEFAYRMAYPDEKNMGETQPSHKASAGRLPMLQMAAAMRYRVLLAELYLQANDPNLFYHLRRVLGNGRYDNEKESGFLDGPAQTLVWEMEKLVAITQKAGLAERLAPEIKSAQNRIGAYQNSVESAYLYPTAESLNNWPDRTIRKFSARPALYGLKFKLANRTILAISTGDKMLKLLETASQDIQDGTVEAQIYNNLGELILGNKDFTGKPFLTLPAGKFLPDFRAALHFKDDSVFANAAGKQTAIYIWTGILAIALIVAVAMFGGGIIIRQARLNKLKNDFIATISHELRTPLASMRVLVDTLLEGRYKDQQQVREYLELASKENARLSRLIDNFLTFSRMERNKQAFDIVQADAAEIAKTAAEAVQAKFNNGKCGLTVTIADGLPSILADKDAMVTVLVNLLDNAYKYSYDDKLIELSVFAEEGSVCFAVKDNGIGLTRRQMRKIFDKFYQVDSSLARKAEGCGLGLSIVKFIVDAHHGKIEVESKPGKGSRFVVKVPGET